MKTTHQLARDLMKFPDVPVKVELWCGWDNPTVVLVEEPGGTKAMIVEEALDKWRLYERTAQ